MGILRLSKAFIIIACLNFIVGVTLGGMMASQPALSSNLAAIHGEINPFGWLTMLIYGMTYAVLVLSLGIRLPFAWQGWLHLAVAEAGVVVVVLAKAVAFGDFFAAGEILQAAAPCFFLYNILSAVIGTRKAKRNGTFVDEENFSFIREGESFRALGRSELSRPTDRIAQRGTDVSLMVFVVAAAWQAVSACLGTITPDSAPFSDSAYLVDYGWIAGTVFAVALHLYPRFAGRPLIPAFVATLSQGLWLVSMVLWIVGVYIADCRWIAPRVLGVALVISALSYLITLRKATKSTLSIRIHGASTVAWWTSWVFAAVLGGCLLSGANPLLPWSMHLLFLGWVTTLVYGVGYVMFPLVLGRSNRQSTWAYAQIVVAVLGACLMPIGLFYGDETAAGSTLLAVGGVLASVAFLLFAVHWLRVGTTDVTH